MVFPEVIQSNVHRSSALVSSSEHFASSEIKSQLQARYEEILLLIHRPFLQWVLNNSTTNIDCMPITVVSRARKAIEISKRVISIHRIRQIIDWITLKQVIVAVLLIAAASRSLGEDMVSSDDVNEAMNGATEIFARAANRSESAKRALQLLSEISVSFKSGEERTM